MVKNKALCLVLIAATGLCGCQTGVMIRVENMGDVELRDVVVEFPSQTETYGNISPKDSTDYHRVTKAYRYAYIEATIDGTTKIIQPIDYVGERRLSGCNYTYLLRFNLIEESFRLELRKD